MSSDGVSNNKPAVQTSVQISDLKNLTPDQINEKISGLSQSEQDAIWAQLRGQPVGNQPPAVTGGGSTPDAGTILNGSQNGNHPMAQVNGESVFGNSNMLVDGQRLTDVTNQFMDFTSYSGGLAYGLGTNAMSSTIGNWFQQVWNCFSFTNAFSRITGSTTLADDVKTTLKPETKPEVKPETKPETKPEVKPETKPEVKPETKPEVKPETKPDVKPETKPETKPVTKKSATKKPAAKSETKPAATPAAPAEPALPKSIKAGNLTMTGDWVKKANALKPGQTMDVKAASGKTYRVTKQYNDTYTSELIPDKTRKFKANVQVSKSYGANGVGQTYEMQYPTGNSIYKSPNTRLTVDADAIFEINGGKYKLNLDDGTMIDSTLDYYQITHQRTFGNNQDLVNNKTGWINPQARLLNTPGKKLYFTGEGKFAGCQLQSLRDMNGTWKVAVVKNNQYYDLNELMQNGREVTFRPGTFIEQG